MNFTSNDNADNPPAGFMPWFDIPGRATADQPIAFGHWSTLMPDYKRTAKMRSNALPLDTGCVWGGCLTAARLGTLPGEFELVQVSCEQAQKPER